jgi:hypothetical protein
VVLTLKTPEKLSIKNTLPMRFSRWKTGRDLGITEGKIKHWKKNLYFCMSRINHYATRPLLNVTGAVRTIKIKCKHHKSQ